MKMLLAADGSDFTTRAINYLVSHFGQFKETPELHLIYIKQPIPDGIVRSFVGRKEIDAYYKEESEKALAPAEALLREKGLSFTSRFIVGNVAQEIQKYVKEHGIEMIVMGSHGHGHFKNLVLGSIATAVISMATVPVLIIR